MRFVAASKKSWRHSTPGLRHREPLAAVDQSKPLLLVVVDELLSKLELMVVLELS
jgi:hypothetical protein